MMFYKFNYFYIFTCVFMIDKISQPMKSLYDPMKNLMKHVNYKINLGRQLIPINTSIFIHP